MNFVAIAQEIFSQCIHLIYFSVSIASSTLSDSKCYNFLQTRHFAKKIYTILPHMLGKVLVIKPAEYFILQIFTSVHHPMYPWLCFTRQTCPQGISTMCYWIWPSSLGSVMYTRFGKQQCCIQVFARRGEVPPDSTKMGGVPPVRGGEVLLI